MSNRYQIVRRPAMHGYYGGVKFPPKSHLIWDRPTKYIRWDTLIPKDDGISLKTVEIDRKGRVVIPKDVREQSRITTPGELVVTAEGTGKITLQSPETSLKRAQEIGRKKLRSWVEDKHEEDELAHRLAREREQA